MIVSDEPIMQQAMPGSSNVTVAEWADLNRFIYTGHENGTICTWCPDVFPPRLLFDNLKKTNRLTPIPTSP